MMLRATCFTTLLKLILHYLKDVKETAKYSWAKSKN